jgi:hypothetical protein
MRKLMGRKLGTSVFLAAVGAVTLSIAMSAPALADDAATQAPIAWKPAVWTTKEVQFVYMGFTTHYTCDGLRDAVREWLLELGARKDDLKVYETACANPNRPDPFPGVQIKMSVLQPAPDNPGADTQVVKAYWKPVRLPYRQYGVDAAGQCELIEQFNHKVLPLFTTRNVDVKTTCVPHQLEPLGTNLQAEVLVTDQSQKKVADAR